MSGGSFDYLCYKMEAAAKILCSKEQPAYRKAFGALMRKCAKAMHDFEWVDSSDMGRGEDEKSIMECIQRIEVIDRTVQEVEETLIELEKMLLQFKSMQDERKN